MFPQPAGILSKGDLTPAAAPSNSMTRHAVSEVEHPSHTRTHRHLSMSKPPDAWPADSLLQTPSACWEISALLQLHLPA